MQNLDLIENEIKTVINFSERTLVIKGILCYFF